MATVVVLLSACGSSARVSTGPRPTVALVDLPRVAHPLDWEAIDFGRLRLWLPPGWQVNTNGCNVTSYANQVTLEPPANECVPDSGTEVTVRLASTRGASAGWRRSTINGVAVWSHRTRDTTVFAAPSLGVRIVAAGSTGMAVALTLGPSPLAALSRLTGPVTVPASWKAIRFDGFSVDVPQKWAVSRVSADCGTLFFGDATVYEDQPQYVASCDIVLPELSPREWCMGG